jgi:hypothetical protein
MPIADFVASRIPSFQPASPTRHYSEASQSAQDFGFIEYALRISTISN